MLEYDLYEQENQFSSSEEGDEGMITQTDVERFREEVESILGEKIDSGRLEREFTQILKGKSEDDYRAECKQDPDCCDQYCHMQICPKQLDPVRFVMVPPEVVRKSRNMG